MWPLDRGHVDDVLRGNQVEEDQVRPDDAVVGVVPEHVHVASERIRCHSPHGGEETVSVDPRELCDGDLERVWNVDAPHTPPPPPASRSLRDGSPRALLRWRAAALG